MNKPAYAICSATDTPSLAAQVNQAMAEGWEIAGGPFFAPEDRILQTDEGEQTVTPSFHQALKKENRIVRPTH